VYRYLEFAPVEDVEDPLITIAEDELSNSVREIFVFGDSGCGEPGLRGLEMRVVEGNGL